MSLAATYHPPRSPAASRPRSLCRCRIRATGSTRHSERSSMISTRRSPRASVESLGAQRHLQGGRLQPLPHAAINRLMGFLDRLTSPTLRGEGSLAALARRLGLSTGELLPLATALHLLAFAELKEGRIKLTAAGACSPGRAEMSARGSSASICCASCRLRRTSGKCSRSEGSTSRQVSDSPSSSRIILRVMMSPRRCGQARARRLAHQLPASYSVGGEPIAA